MIIKAKFKGECVGDHSYHDDHRGTDCAELCEGVGAGDEIIWKKGRYSRGQLVGHLSCRRKEYKNGFIRLVRDAIKSQRHLSGITDQGIEKEIQVLMDIWTAEQAR